MPLHALLHLGRGHPWLFSKSADLIFCTLIGFFSRVAAIELRHASSALRIRCYAPGIHVCGVSIGECRARQKKLASVGPCTCLHLPLRHLRHQGRARRIQVWLGVQAFFAVLPNSDVLGFAWCLMGFKVWLRWLGTPTFFLEQGRQRRCGSLWRRG